MASARSADLEWVFSAVAVLQEGPVAAILICTVADLGDADPVPVIAAEMGRRVYVQLVPQGEEGLASLPVLPAQIQLAQPAL